MLNNYKNTVLLFALLLSLSMPSLATDADLIKAKDILQQKRFLDAQEQLPWPHELADDIQFWINVYTKIGAGSGYIHDAKHLNVIYGKIKFDPDINRKARNKLVKQHKKRITRILKHLAKGDRKNLSDEEQRILALWPENISGAELKEAIERVRFQLGQAEKFKDGIVRSGRWMPHIAAMMEKHDVPDLLRLLPHVESSFIPYARSHVGAAGMWQFTRATGRRFMKVNHVLDERLDPYIAAEAAAKLLRHNYDRINSWPLAITAYNHGLRSMRKAAEKFGKDNLVEILTEYDGTRFGFASRNFYLSFLAAAHVHINYKKYFGDLAIEEYQNPDIFRLPNYLSAHAIKASSIDNEALQLLNPALSSAVWEGNKYFPKNYPMRVPRGMINEIVSIDKKYWHAKQIPDLFHKVRRGESLSQIAQRHKVRLSALKKANNIRNVHRIRIGQRLVLPGRVAAQNTTAEKIAQREVVNDVYTVQKGDTVGEIAKAFKLSPENLMTWNKISDARQLQIGQGLRLKQVLLVAEPLLAAKENNFPIIPESLTENVAPIDMDPLTEKVAAVNLKPSNADTSSADVKQEANIKLDENIYNYAVHDDHTIEVLPQETLGHYADWLKIYAKELRAINNMRFKSPVVIGNRLKLSFDKVSVQEFEQKRQAYHLALQENFHQRYKIQGKTTYQIKSGDSLWLLAQRNYQVPMWLLRQYNPDMEIQKIRPGATVVFPLVVKR